MTVETLREEPLREHGVSSMEKAILRLSDNPYSISVHPSIPQGERGRGSATV